MSLWDEAAREANLTYTYAGSGTGLPTPAFASGVLNAALASSFGPFSSTGHFLDVGIEDAIDAIPGQGMGTETILKVSEQHVPGGGAPGYTAFVGLHYQFTGGGHFYIWANGGAGFATTEPGSVDLAFTHVLEISGGINDLGSAPASIAGQPYWLRLVVGDTTLTFTAEIWATDPALGGTPVASVGPVDPGITGAVAGDPTPVLFSRIDPGAGLTVDEWVVNAISTPPAGADSITCAAAPTTIVADGNQQSVLTATVLDADGNPLPAETVVFTADSATPGAAGTCSPTTNHHNGIYTAKYTDTTTAGDVTITATDGALSATCVIHQTPTATGNVGFGPPQVGVVRQGRS